MNKKHIILISVSAFTCFAAAFASSWFTRKSFSKQPAEQPQQNNISLQPEFQNQMQPMIDSAEKKEISEKQLKKLLYDAREKIREYESKQQQLQSGEQRLQITQESLKKDIEKLDNLKVDIAAMIANLKAEQESLNSSRVKVEQTEKANLIGVAAMYDKMDPASAGQILTNLSKLPPQSPNAQSGIDDAVKILFYMTERTKAKVMAELVSSEPALAALFCEKLKRISETE